MSYSKTATHLRVQMRNESEDVGCRDAVEGEVVLGEVDGH